MEDCALKFRARPVLESSDQTLIILFGRPGNRVSPHAEEGVAALASLEPAFAPRERRKAGHVLFFPDLEDLHCTGAILASSAGEGLQWGGALTSPLAYREQRGLGSESQKVAHLQEPLASGSHQVTLLPVQSLEKQPCVMLETPNPHGLAFKVSFHVASARAPPSLRLTLQKPT